MSKILNTYNRKKISFSKGKGSFLYTTNGKKYLDFVQGIAVNCLGHANDYLIRSINKQSKKLWHVSNVFTIPEQERLAKRLAQKTFADYVTFQNSGAEATEAAIKFARRYFYSIERLPDFLQAVSKVNPFFYMIDGFRYSFIGTSDGSISIGLVYLTVLSFVSWLVCYLLYKKGYKIKS